MDTRNNKRIGIFEYDWSFYHYIKDFAIKLAEAGFGVDIFLKDWDVRPNFADTNDFTLNQNIRFFDFTVKETRRQAMKRKYARLLNKIAIHFSVSRNSRPDRLIDRAILDKSKDIIGTSQYYCLIGMEKKGLIWAGLLSEAYHWPLIYFSLELYIEDNPALFRFYHIREAEKKYHKRAIATIIQDSARGAILAKSNGLESSNILYFPVSANGAVVRQKSTFLRDRLPISSNKKILLYFGGIEKDRFLSQIVSMAKALDEDTILVVHGVGPKKYIKYLQSIADSNKVLFSLGFISENEIQKLVSSADIGIALYKTTNANDRLIAFSSSKVAYYTQCGLPMIAFDTENFRELVKSYKCAELIEDVNEIPLKARKILEQYNLYREQSYAAYQNIYNLDQNTGKLIGHLEKIIDAGQPEMGRDL